jgi:hypothetical protein
VVRPAYQQMARHHADEAGIGAVVPVVTQKGELKVMTSPRCGSPNCSSGLSLSGS